MLHHLQHIAMDLQGGWPDFRKLYGADSGSATTFPLRHPGALCNRRFPSVDIIFNPFYLIAIVNIKKIETDHNLTFLYFPILIFLIACPDTSICSYGGIFLTIGKLVLSHC